MKKVVNIMIRFLRHLVVVLCVVLLESSVALANEGDIFLRGSIDYHDDYTDVELSNQENEIALVNKEYSLLSDEINYLDNYNVMAMSNQESEIDKLYSSWEVSYWDESVNYSDIWFFHDSHKENKELAVLSCLASDAAYNDSTSFLSSCGYKYISTYSVKPKVSSTNIDTGHNTTIQIGWKSVPEKNVICMQF